jgi:hypothetical protein
MTLGRAVARFNNIRHSVVGLKMPRPLEKLAATLRRIQWGEIDVSNDLFAEEPSLGENRRIKAALQMASLPILKSLAGFPPARTAFCVGGIGDGWILNSGVVMERSTNLVS